jgi:hypothetical protein
MARYIVPAVLVALVAGYAVGQQPSQGPTVAPAASRLIDRYDRDLNGKLDAEESARFRWAKLMEADRNGDEAVTHEELTLWLEARGQKGQPAPAPPSYRAQIGRYAPAGPDRMLDTTNGILYAVNEDKWRIVATLESGATAANVQHGAAAAVDKLGRDIDAEIQRILDQLSVVEGAIERLPLDSDRRADLEQGRGKLLKSLVQFERMKPRIRDPKSESEPRPSAGARRE